MGEFCVIASPNAAVPAALVSPAVPGWAMQARGLRSLMQAKTPALAATARNGNDGRIYHVKQSQRGRASHDGGRLDPCACGLVSRGAASAAIISACEAEAVWRPFRIGRSGWF